MVHIVVLGAGLGGLPTAYELRHLLPKSHRITLISDNPKFTFIPSLPWVAFDLTPLDKIQLNLETLLFGRDIDWIPGKVTGLDPHTRIIEVAEQTLHYDYTVIATGAFLALDAVPGLGPETGYTQSVCNPHHALLARSAWLEFLKNPGPLVVGAVPDASCFGPLYEFALLADYVLRKRGLRHRVPITVVTPEPYAGHLGIGGMANSTELVTQLLQQRGIEFIENAEITEISPCQIHLVGGRSLPFQYSMLLPPFQGAKFLREAKGLTDKKGFVPILPTYQHPDFPSIYSLGVAVQLTPPETTPIPIGVPKTGQMTEAMGMAIAHNIARELGVIQAAPVTPTLAAICMADFGNTGIIFIADPVLPNLATGKRRKSVAKKGWWVSWIKSAFEKFFLAKMRLGLSIPWFERWGLQMMGLSLVEPIPDRSNPNLEFVAVHSPLPTEAHRREDLMRGRIRQLFSWLFLLGTLVLFIFLGLGTVNTPPAQATIQTIQESPSQILYQSRHKLRDDRGNAWQVVLFKRVKADESSSINLRLVAFPGTAEFAHPQPLTITTKLGETFQAEDLFAEQAPTENVGQYNFENILNQLPRFASVNFSVMMKDDRQVELLIPPEVILEWQTISKYS